MAAGAPRGGYLNWLVTWHAPLRRPAAAHGRSTSRQAGCRHSRARAPPLPGVCGTGVQNTPQRPPSPAEPSAAPGLPAAKLLLDVARARRRRQGWAVATVSIEHDERPTLPSVRTQGSAAQRSAERRTHTDLRPAVPGHVPAHGVSAQRPRGSCSAGRGGCCGSQRRPHPCLAWHPLVHHAFRPTQLRCTLVTKSDGPEKPLCQACSWWLSGVLVARTMRRGGRT